MVSMVAPVLVIGAVHWLEALAHVRNSRAQTFEHCPNDMIAQDEDAIFVDLSGQMPVAQMPGEMTERRGRSSTDLMKVFLRGNDIDDAAVSEDQRIAIGQQDGFGKVNHHVFARAGRQQLAAKMPFAVIEEQRAGAFGMSVMGVGNGVQH
jgi:hypothetical protein